MKYERSTPLYQLTAPLTLLPNPCKLQDIHRPRNTRPKNKRETRKLKARRTPSHAPAQVLGKERCVQLLHGVPYLHLPSRSTATHPPAAQNPDKHGSQPLPTGPPSHRRYGHPRSSAEKPSSRSANLKMAFFSSNCDERCIRQMHRHWQRRSRWNCGQLRAISWRWLRAIKRAPERMKHIVRNLCDDLPFGACDVVALD